MWFVINEIEESLMGFYGRPKEDFSVRVMVDLSTSSLPLEATFRLNSFQLSYLLISWCAHAIVLDDSAVVYARLVRARSAEQMCLDISTHDRPEALSDFVSEQDWNLLKLVRNDGEFLRSDLKPLVVKMLLQTTPGEACDCSIYTLRHSEVVALAQRAAKTFPMLNYPKRG